METLDELIEYLEHSIDRAESDSWAALHLNVAEAKKLLPGLSDDPSFFKCKWCDWHDRCFSL